MLCPLYYAYPSAVTSDPHYYVFFLNSLLPSNFFMQVIQVSLISLVSSIAYHIHLNYYHLNLFTNSQSISCFLDLFALILINNSFFKSYPTFTLILSLLIFIYSFLSLFSYALNINFLNHIFFFYQVIMKLIYS